MASAKHPHTCKNCSRDFLGRKLQQFCSKNCSNEWSRGRLNVGVVRDIETRAKIGEKSRGRQDSHETRLKKSLSHRGPLHYRWREDRAQLQLEHKLRNFNRNLLKRALKAKGGVKASRTVEMLGYTPEDFRQHIEAQFESWMNWENWGKGPGTWQVDHIKPLAQFAMGTAPSVVNALDNLRPLSFEENIRRSWKTPV